MALNPESLLAHADFVRALARSLVLDEHSAEDVVQETWLAALEHPPRPIAPLRGWLAAVARNFARLAKRERIRRAARERAAARGETVTSTEKIVEWESVRRRVVEAVLALEEPYRSMIVYRFYDGLAPREIARRLGIPVETVKTRLKRGLARLRQHLDAGNGMDGRTWTLALAPLVGLKTGVLSTGLSTTLTGVLAMSAKIKAGAIAAVILAAAAVFIAVIEEDSRQTPPGAQEERSSMAEDAARNTPPESEAPPSPKEAPSPAAAATPARESLPPLEGGRVELKGRVLDDQGEPLEEAMVQQAFRKYWDGAHWLTGDLKWTDTGILTGQDGAFRILIPRDDKADTWLNIQKPGYELTRPVAAINAMPGADGALDLGDIRVYPALAIRGQVVDEKGHPVSGCRVSALNPPWVEGNRYIETTDEEGRFRQVFPNIDWGTDHLVKAFKDGIGMGWSPCPEPARLDEAPEVTVILHPCGAISGRLLSGEGSPSEGTPLTALVNFSKLKMTLWDRTDEEGRFRFYPAPEGTFELRAHPPGYFDEKEGWGVVLDKEVPAGREGLTFRLPPLARIELYFTDDSGNPVACEPPSVSLWRIRDDPLYQRIGSSTNFDLNEVKMSGPGRFCISNVSPGIYRIGCYFQEYDHHLFEDVAVPAGMETVRLEAALIKYPMILGQVLHPDGRPAKGIKLVCQQSRPSPDQAGNQVPFTPFGLRIPSGRATDPRTEVTDEEGRFCFKVFPHWGSRDTTFHVYAYLENRVVLRESPIELSRESPQKVLSLTLPGGPQPSGAIEGFIRDAKGNPLGNALVAAWDGKDVINRTRANAEGFYRFTAMPGGRYIVDGRALTTSLDRTTPIGNRKWLRKGFEDLDKLDPYNASVAKGGTVRCDLIVQDPWNGSISGRLVWASRSAPLDFEVELYAVNDKGHRKEYDEDYERPTAGDLFSFIWDAIRDEDPRQDGFRFNDLKAGRYRISVTASGYDSEGSYFRCHMTSAEVMLEPSGQRELTLDLKIASLNGRVLDQETGEPVPGARIGMGLEPPAWWRQFALWFTTGSDGAFACATVPAGTYHIRITHDGYAELRKKDLIFLPNEDKSDLEFFLEPPNTLEGVFKIAGGAGEVKNHYVEIEPEKWDGQSATGRISEAGRFTFENLPAGPARVIVRGPRRFVLEKNIHLPLLEGEILVIDAP